MKIELYGEPVRMKRLFLYLLPFFVMIAAAVVFLPSGLVRLSVIGLLLFPPAAVLLDRPRWVFYLLLIILFSNLDIFTSFHMFRYMLVFFAASFALAVANGRRIVIHDRTFFALVLAFLIMIFQSMAVARNVDVSLWRMGLFIKILINIPIAVQFVRTREEFRRLFLLLAVGILINNFLPFIKAPPTRYANISLLWTQGVLRYEGFALEPNLFAQLQIFLIPILLFLVAVYRKPRLARPFFLIALLASIILLFMSFSRGGFVSLVFLFIFLLFVERRNRVVLFTGMSLIVVGAVVAPAVYWDRIGSLFEAGSDVKVDWAVVTRLETMKVALMMGLKHPFLGVGLDNFLYHAARFIPYQKMVHNVFLQVFSEVGIFALAVFLGIISYNLRIIRGLIRRSSDPEAAQLGRILLIHQFAVIFNAMFIPVAYENTFWFTLAIPAMARFAYRDKVKEDKPQSSSSSGPSP